MPLLHGSCKRYICDLVSGFLHDKQKNSLTHLQDVRPLEAVSFLFRSTTFENTKLKHVRLVDMIKITIFTFRGQI